jgi:hypothetical protein
MAIPHFDELTGAGAELPAFRLELRHVANVSLAIMAWQQDIDGVVVVAKSCQVRGRCC